MKIGILGWGSLIWKPGKLRLKSKWHVTGPMLPIDFGRKSIDGRLTLVICPDRELMRTYWAMSAAESLQEATDDLWKREGHPYKKYICSIKASAAPQSEVEKVLHAWITELNKNGIQLDAAIWTALPPKRSTTEGEEFPSDDEAIKYLRTLDGDALDLAREYITHAPKFIDTSLRRKIEKELGWMRVPLDNELFEPEAANDSQGPEDGEQG